jgi:hypothetical protein
VATKQNSAQNIHSGKAKILCVIGGPTGYHSTLVHTTVVGTVIHIRMGDLTTKYVHQNFPEMMDASCTKSVM